MTMMAPRLLNPQSCFVCFCLALMMAIPACQPYEREISRRGILTDFSDATQGNSGAQARPAYVDPVFALPEGKIRVEDEDGNVTLYAKSVKHLMNHIIQTLENGERDLFTEQILSQITVDEFKERNLDPGLAFDELAKRRKQIYQCFHLMPNGEYSPGLFLKPIGTNMFRLAVSRAGHSELLWIGMDVSFEQSNYRLRWFVR